MKIKNNGFTILELLGAVVIISVLGGIVVPIISGYMQEGKDTYNKNLEQQLVLAGKNYYADNRDKASSDSESYATYVSLQELETSNYVKGEFIDADGGICKENSYVKVIRNPFDNKNNEYYGCLFCENYSSDENKCMVTVETDKVGPSCTITTEPVHTTWSNNFKVNVTLIDDFALDSIYYFQNGKIEYSSLHKGGIKKEVTKTFFVKKDTNYFLKNTKKFWASVTDAGGNSSACEVDLKYDDENPTCIVKNSSGGVWTNKDVTVSATCTDTGESGCVKSIIDEKTYSDNVNITVDFGDAFDHAGNKDSCDKTDVKIDKTAPTCTVKNSSGGVWTNKDVIVSATCTDTGGSGCRTENTTKVYTSNINQTIDLGTVCDNAGNCTKCSSTDVKIDKTNPTCSIANSSGGSWTNKDVTITASCKDSGGSGCKTSAITEEFTTPMDKTVVLGTIYDNAGNSATCSSSVRIDRISPKCKVTSTADSSWTNDTVVVTGNCTDEGGSNCTKSKITKNITYSITGSVSPGYVQDAAGNRTECGSVSLRVDKDPPTCYVTNSSGGSWTNKDVTITGTCSDGESGCRTTGTLSKSYSSNTNSSISVGTVYDNVGNYTICPKTSVRIDKTSPTCTPYNSSGGDWGAPGVIVYGACSDTGGSGCVSSQVNRGTYYSTTSNINLGTAYDNAGNYASCGTTSVKIDSTPPTCTTSSSTGSSWTTKKSSTITGKCKDSGSGCKSSSVTTKVTTQGESKVSPGTVYDNAGNSTKCGKETVRLDWTEPKCTGNSSYYGKHSTNGNRGYKYTFTDNASGVTKVIWGHCYSNLSSSLTDSCGYQSANERRDSKYDKGSWTSVTSSGTSAYHVLYFERASGTMNVKFYLKDKAGNENRCTTGYSNSW